jgi:hypothetical protein
MVARADSGALSHGFVGACRERNARFAIGYGLTETVRTAVLSIVRWEAPHPGAQLTPAKGLLKGWG